MRRLWIFYQTRCVREERGASMVEYSLLVGLIAIVAIVAVVVFGGAISESFQSSSDTWPP